MRDFRNVPGNVPGQNFFQLSLSYPPAPDSSRCATVCRSTDTLKRVEQVRSKKTKGRGRNFRQSLQIGCASLLALLVGCAVLALSSCGVNPTASANPSGSAGKTTAGVLDSLSCANGAMTGSGTDTCTVNLTDAAGSGGLAVSVSSSNVAVAVPGSVTVTAGATSGSFTATVSAVTASQTVTLAASAGGVTKSYAISLNAGVSALTLQSTSVAFGDVSLNSPSTQAVVLTSSGTIPVTVSTASISGGSGFSITGPSFPLTIPPGKTATLYLQFDPASAGPASGGVTLTTTTGGTAVIQMTGTGVTTAYEVDLSWNAPANSSDPAVSYDVYRAVSGSASYLELGSSGDTSYSDNTVADGTSYVYYVKSVDAQGNQSAPSNMFTINIP